MNNKILVRSASLAIVFGLATIPYRWDLVQANPISTPNVFQGSRFVKTQGFSPKALTGTTKLCSVVAPANYRDTIPVNNSWTNATCATYFNAIVGNFYQLGCIFPTGFSFGAPNGGIPNPNCGW